MIWDCQVLCSRVHCQIGDDPCPLPKKTKSKKLVWTTLKNLPLQLIVRKHRRQPRILTYRKLISWPEVQQLTGSIRMNLYLLKVVEWLGHPLNKKVSKFFKKVYAKILKIFFSKFDAFLKYEYFLVQHNPLFIPPINITLNSKCGGIRNSDFESNEFKMAAYSMLNNAKQC